jgi:hypothetical protein
MYLFTTCIHAKPLLAPATYKFRHQKIYVLSDTTNDPKDETIGSRNIVLPPSYASLELLASTSHKPKMTSGLKPLLRFPLFGAKVLERKCLHTFITCPHAKFSTHNNDQQVEIKLKNNYTIHAVMPLFYTLYKFSLRNVFLILSTV